MSVDLPVTGGLDIRAITARDGALLAGVLAGVTRGLYRSVDSGVHWTEISTTMPVDDQVLSLVATEDDLLVGFAKGVYRTADLGATWLFAGQGTAAIRGTASLLVHDGALVVGLQTNGGQGMGVRLTGDAGETWTSATGIAINTAPVALAEQGGVLFGAVYGSDRGVLRSEDGGVTWTDASAGLPPNINMRALLAHDGVLLAGAWDGLFRSTDGQTWTQVAGVPTSSRSASSTALFTRGSATAARAARPTAASPGRPSASGCPRATACPASRSTTARSTPASGAAASTASMVCRGPSPACPTRSSRPCTRPRRVDRRGILPGRPGLDRRHDLDAVRRWSGRRRGQRLRRRRHAHLRRYPRPRHRGHPLTELTGSLTDVPPVATGNLRVAPNPFNPRTEIRFVLPEGSRSR